MASALPPGTSRQATTPGERTPRGPVNVLTCMKQGKDMNAKPRFAIALAGAAVLLLAGIVHASQSAKHEAEELHRVNLSLLQAIMAAEKEDGGKATSADFQFKR